MRTAESLCDRRTLISPAQGATPAQSGFRRLVRRTLKRLWQALVLVVTPGARPADPSSPDSPRVPFAVALCLGTLVVMCEQLLQNGLVRRLAGA